jgi:hypothetical protein
MKSLLLLCVPVAAALSGCAAYVGDPYGGYGYGGYPAAGYYGYPAAGYDGYGYGAPSVSIGVYGNSGDRWRGRGGDGRRWDRDRDGVPNRADSRPDNPYRR